MVAKDEPGGLGPAQPPGDRHRPLHPRPPRLLQLRRLFQIFTDRKNGQLKRGSNRLNLKFINHSQCLAAECRDCCGRKRRRAGGCN